MIAVSNIEVWGFEHAIRGMRNPMNSWKKSDSRYETDETAGATGRTYVVGPNDLGLMQRLFKAGTEHRKYLRQITVAMDITGPLYWWKEFDTYKVGTTANSCSTMHKISAALFTRESFSLEHLNAENLAVMDQVIAILNHDRDVYLASRSKDDWWQMIQMLPTTYNQKRTVTMNYENVYTIIRQRTGHKLDEWNQFVAELQKLPYVQEIADR